MTSALRLCKLAADAKPAALGKEATAANCDQRDSFGHTPLLRAAWAGGYKPNEGHVRCAGILLRLGADPNAVDADGFTPMHWAAESGNCDVMPLLLRHGAKLDAVNVKQRNTTPLMLACFHGNGMAAKQLLQLGADHRLRDTDGDTARDLAEGEGFSDIVRILDKWCSSSRMTVGRDAVQDERFELEPEPAQSVAPRLFRSASATNSADVEDEDADSQWLNESFGGSSQNRFYSVSSPVRGVCAVVNVRHYSSRSKFSDRPGSEVDVKRVQKLFASLRFELKLIEDKTSSEIYWQLADIARRDHTRFGMFVCFLMAHGTDGAIYGADGQPQSIKELLSLFQPNKCPSLKSKPKVFFSQSCRGTVDDLTVSEHCAATQTDGEAPVRDQLQGPQRSDFLICYANTEESPAYRNPTTGSVFVQTLCSVVSEECRHSHLEDMILEVNNRVTHTPIPGGRGVYYHAVIDKNGRLTKKIFLCPQDY